MSEAEKGKFKSKPKRRWKASETQTYCRPSATGNQNIFSRFRPIESGTLLVEKSPGSRGIGCLVYDLCLLSYSGVGALHAAVKNIR
jgi:hypothetical protein